MVLFAGVIAFFLIKGSPVPASEFTLSGAGVGNTIAFVLLGAFASFMAPDLWQRIYAAKTKKIARNALYLTSLILMIFGILITLIGVIAKLNYPDILPSDALMYGLSHLLPSGLLGLGLVMLFAAIMSTLDSYLFILGMNISEDITKNYKDLKKESLIKLTRWSIIIITAISVIIAINVQSIISVALAFGSISMALIPGLIGSFHFNLKRKAVFVSILAGIISVFAILFSGYISPQSSLISLPTSLVFLILGQIFFKKK
jgi:SSS family solute:Na+ symporter